MENGHARRWMKPAVVTAPPIAVLLIGAILEPGDGETADVLVVYWALILAAALGVFVLALAGVTIWTIASRRASRQHGSSDR